MNGRLQFTKYCWYTYTYNKAKQSKTKTYTFLWAPLCVWTPKTNTRYIRWYIRDRSAPNMFPTGLIPQNGNYFGEHSYCKGRQSRDIAVRNGFSRIHHQGSFCESTQPVRDDVIMQRHLSLAGRIHGLVTAPFHNQYFMYAYGWWIFSNIRTRFVAFYFGVHWKPKIVTTPTSPLPVAMQVIVMATYLHSPHNGPVTGKMFPFDDEIFVHYLAKLLVVVTPLPTQSDSLPTKLSPCYVNNLRNQPWTNIPSNCFGLDKCSYGKQLIAFP